jgi:uncharacterized protein (DUF58 family)
MSLRLWIRRQSRKRPRIYIMPTRMGGYLNGLIFLMFLLSVGYSNNLLLIFTLFLFAFNLLWVIQTHFFLNSLKLDTIVIHEGHAGEQLDVILYWKNTPEGPFQWHLTLESDSHIAAISSKESDTLKTSGSVKFQQRGLKIFTHLGVETEKPFGLYRAWMFQKTDVRVVVYPSKLTSAPDVISDIAHLEGDQGSARAGPHDIRNLAPYQGEESRRISWKHYAKSGDLIVKEGEELAKSEVHFRVCPDKKDRELELSRITTQMLYCTRHDILFSLETPGKKTRSASTLNHLNDCLRELALC